MANIYKRCNNHETKHHRLWNVKPTHTALLIFHVWAVWYYLTSTVCEGLEFNNDFRLVDLTHIFDNSTIYWITEPSLVLNVTYNGTMPGRTNWYQKDEFSAATHGGTHMDAPCHFAKGRWCVSDVPLDHLVVPASVVDISDHVNGNPDVHLTKNMILEWENKYGQIPHKSLLLIYTGWSEFWTDRLKYVGTLNKDISSLKFPSIKVEVAEWLVTNRNIVGIGIDTMSVDIPKERPGTHVTLMENNIYGLENVNNLDQLPPKGAMVYVMPMNLRDASGAPCRLIAQIPRSATSGGNNCSCIQIILMIATLCVIHRYKSTFL